MNIEENFTKVICVDSIHTDFIEGDIYYILGKLNKDYNNIYSTPDLKLKYMIGSYYSCRFMLLSEWRDKQIKGSMY